MNYVVFNFLLSWLILKETKIVDCIFTPLIFIVSRHIEFVRTRIERLKFYIFVSLPLFISAHSNVCSSKLKFYTYVCSLYFFLYFIKFPWDLFAFSIFLIVQLFKNFLVVFLFPCKFYFKLFLPCNSGIQKSENFSQTIFRA